MEIEDRDFRLTFTADQVQHGFFVNTPCPAVPQYMGFSGDSFWETWRTQISSTVQDMMYQPFASETRWLGYWISQDEEWVYGALFLQKVVLSEKVSFFIVLETQPCSSFVPLAQVIHYRKSLVHEWFTSQRNVFMGTRNDLFTHESKEKPWDRMDVCMGAFVSHEWIDRYGNETLLGDQKNQFLISHATILLDANSRLETVSSVEDMYFSFQQLELIHQISKVTDALLLTLRAEFPDLTMTSSPHLYNSDWYYFKSFYESHPTEPSVMNSLWESSVSIRSNLNTHWIAPTNAPIFNAETDLLLASFLDQSFFRFRNHLDQFFHFKPVPSQLFSDFINIKVSPFSQFMEIPSTLSSDLHQTMIQFKVSPSYKWSVKHLQSSSMIPPDGELFPKEHIVDKETVFLAPLDMENVECLEEYHSYCLVELRIWIRFRFPMCPPVVYHVFSKWNVLEWNVIQSKIRSTLDVYRQIYSFVLFQLGSMVLHPNRLGYNLDCGSSIRNQKSCFDIAGWLSKPQPETDMGVFCPEVRPFSVLITLNPRLTDHVMREWVAEAMIRFSALFGRTVFSLDDPQVIGWVQHRMSTPRRPPFRGSVRIGGELYKRWFDKLARENVLFFAEIQSDLDMVFMARNWLDMTFIPLFGNGLGTWENGWVNVTECFKVSFPFQVLINGAFYGDVDFFIEGTRFCPGGGKALEQLVKKYISYLKVRSELAVEKQMFLFSPLDLSRRRTEPVGIPFIRFSTFTQKLPVIRKHKRGRYEISE